MMWKQLLAGTMVLETPSSQKNEGPTTEVNTVKTPAPRPSKIPTPRSQPVSTTAQSRLISTLSPSVSTKRRLSTLARQTRTPLPASVSIRPKITASTRLTRSITKTMAELTQPPASDTTIPTVVPSATLTITPPTPLSVSDLNIHSVPNLPVWLKDIYARLDSQANQISEMQALIQENQSLRSSLDQTKQQLEQAHQRIQELESQKAPPAPIPESTVRPTVTQPTYASLAKKPADPSATNKSKAKAPSRKKSQPLNLEVNDAGLAAARHFSAVSPTHGFQFVYIPSRGRSATSKLRDDFHAMGIHNKRVLDIHFPDRHVCGLLIHNDYYASLTTQLTKYKLDPIDFDPMDTTKLRDPKYLEWDSTTLAEECRRLFLARVKVIIARLKDSNHQLAVARHFTFKEALIPETDYATMATTIKPAYIPAYKRQPPSTATQDDDMEAEATTTNNITPLSPNHNARADETSAHEA